MTCKCAKCGKEAEIVCFVDDSWCEECALKALGTPPDMNSKTNYEKIIGLSIEQMAAKIASSIDCNICEETFGKRPCDGKSCTNCWLDWLRQEAK